MSREQSTRPGSIRVLDPAGLVQSFASARTLAMPPLQWPETLDSKKIGFLSNGKSNVEILFRIINELLVERGGNPVGSFIKEGPVVPAGDDLISALAETADIAIMGICDGGTATSWGIRDALILAGQGVPSVLICTDAFVPLAQSIMPLDADGVHLITVPHPFSSLLEPEVREIASSFVTALDKALTTGEWPEWRITSAQAIDPIERLQPHLEHSTFALPNEDAIIASQVLYQRGLTDGLPVGIPTPNSVDAALSSWTGGEDTEDIAVIPPRNGRATPIAIATNAILAGLPNSILPYLGATISAACQPEFNLLGLQTTTNPTTPVIVVGGPRHQEFGFNHGLGALGPGNMSNATLGRALRLCMQNLGGARVSDGSDPATMGQPGKYTFSFAADEEACPWLPLRLQTNPNELSHDDDSVTVIAGTGSLNMIIKSTSGEELLSMISSSIRISGSNDYMFGGHPLLILCPEHMEILVHDGFNLTDTRDYLFEHTKIPFSEFLPKNQEMMRAPRRDEFRTITQETDIPMVKHPSDFLICAAGGPSLHSTFVPSFGGSVPVSAKVKLEDTR